MSATKDGTGVYLITRRFEFEAAHYLTLVPAGHKCSRMHGHNYVVTVELATETLDPCGFVVDYGELAKFRAHLDRVYDHRVLNDVVGFEPTAEMLARHWFGWCLRKWPQTSAVRVEETRGTSATYRP